MLRYLPVLSAIPIVIFSGIVHGLQTNRWSKPPDIRAAVARLDRVAKTIGDWEGQPQPLDPRDLDKAGIEGALSRRYRNRKNGSTVSVLLVCGRPGPIAVHTPEVCYSGAGFEQLAASVKHSVPRDDTSRPSRFWVANFQRRGPAFSDYLRIFWSWSGSGSWNASESPRRDYASLPLLYKLYLVREVSAPAEPLADDPGNAFCQQLLPEIDRVLFADHRVGP